MSSGPKDTGVRMRLFGVAAVVAAMMLGCCATAHAGSPGFTSSYMRMEPWWGGQCVTSAGIVGREPSKSGRYPVFVYIVGLGGNYNGTEAVKFMEEAARRGFVAASLQYDSFGSSSPEGVDKSSGCMFNESSSASALAKLCARRKADCSKGVAVAGNSLGGAIAGRAANHSARVRAAYLLGVNGPVSGPQSGFQKDANGEVVPMAVAPSGGGSRALANDRIRITVGKEDGDPAWPNGQEALDAMTGRGCFAVSSNCLGADGSGYYIVQHSEVADGFADHCFFHGAGGCSNTPPFDPGWLPPSQLPWALSPGLDWLATRVTS